MVIHTGDFKIDTTPVGCEMTDLTRFGELGKAGVLALLSDLLPMPKEAATAPLSARWVRPWKSFLKAAIKNYYHNLCFKCVQGQQIINIAAKHGRKVA
jgi:ribonuclease J